MGAGPLKLWAWICLSCKVGSILISMERKYLAMIHPVVNYFVDQLQKFNAMTNNIIDACISNTFWTSTCTRLPLPFRWITRVTCCCMGTCMHIPKCEVKGYLQEKYWRRLFILFFVTLGMTSELSHHKVSAKYEKEAVTNNV